MNTLSNWPGFKGRFIKPPVKRLRSSNPFTNHSTHSFDNKPFTATNKTRKTHLHFCRKLFKCIHRFQLESGLDCSEIVYIFIRKLFDEKIVRMSAIHEWELWRPYYSGSGVHLFTKFKYMLVHGVIPTRYSVPLTFIERFFFKTLNWNLNQRWWHFKVASD